MLISDHIFRVLSSRVAVAVQGMSLVVFYILVKIQRKSSSWLKQLQSNIRILREKTSMLRIVPTTDKRSLCTRFMPESLKQMKKAIQNVLTHMLKKKEKLGRFQICHSKRNKYAEVPQERTQGDRKRKMIVPEDQVLSDEVSYPGCWSSWVSWGSGIESWNCTSWSRCSKGYVCTETNEEKLHKSCQW